MDDTSRHLYNAGINASGAFSSVMDFLNTAAGVAKNEMQKQAELDSTYFRAELQKDSAELMQKLQTLPEGADYDAEINNFYQSRRSQMQNPKSKYYARNQYTAKIFEDQIVSVMGNAKANAVKIDYEKKKDSALAKGQTLVTANREMKASTERIDNNFSVYQNLYDQGFISAQQKLNMESEEVALTAMQMAEGFYTDYVKSNAKKGIYDEAQDTKASRIQIQAEMETYCKEHGIAVDVENACNKGIEKAKINIKNQQDQNNGDWITKKSKLYDGVATGAVSMDQAIGIAQSRIMQLENLNALELNPQQKEQRLAEYRSFLNLAESAQKNGTSSTRGALNFNDIISDIKAQDDEYIRSMLQNPAYTGSIYGLKNAYKQVFNDRINQRISDMRSAGWTSDDIAAQYQEVNAAFNEFTGLVEKNMDLLPGDKKAVCETAIKNIKNLVNSTAKKNTADNSDLYNKTIDFMWDYFMGQDISKVSADDITEASNKFVNGVIGEEIDRLTYNKKGEMPAVNNARGVAKTLQQQNNSALLYTDEYGARVFANPETEDVIWNGEATTQCRVELYNFLMDKDLKKTLQIGNITQSWEVDDTGYDLNPRINFTVNSGTFAGRTYRFNSEDGKKVILEIKEKDGSWSAVKNYEPKFDQKKKDAEALKAAQKAAKAEYKESKKEADEYLNAQEWYQDIREPYYRDETGNIVYVPEG